MSGRMPAATERDPNRLAQAIRELFAGRSNAAGAVTLRTSNTTTPVTAPNIGEDSKIFLSPTTAHAAAEIGNGTIYVSDVQQGGFTITHASNSQADRTFWWRIAD